MGGPMTWGRLVARNGLKGDYGSPTDHVNGMHGNRSIAGDMRRVERDMVSDEYGYLAKFAAAAGVTTEQARAVLLAFFQEENWR